MENDFGGNNFFSEDPLQQINDGTLQSQIDQLDPSAVGLDVATTVPINANVLQRLISLNRNGCSTRLAWSRQGHIASISEDGTGVDLQYLSFDRRKRSWGLSPKRKEHVGSGQLANLAWSPMASDLVVVDTDGHLSILRPVGTTANRLSELKVKSADDDSSFGRAIGVHWLSQDRAERAKQVIQSTSKSEETGKWVHRHVKAVPLQPFYQRAIIVVSQDAKLALIYEKRDTSFGRLSCPLTSKNEDIYTHAAFAPTTSGSLLVALHRNDGRISAYSVSMDFTPIASDGLPTLQVELAASMLPSMGVVPDGQLYRPEAQYLTHLGIIQTTEIEKSARLPPTVYGMYANLNQDVGPSNNAFLPTGTIRRWTLAPVEQILFSKWNETATKVKQATPETPITTIAVEQLPDNSEQVITNATVLENAQGLHITTMDGRTDFLSTEDLSSLTFSAAPDNAISSLAQAGFAFPLIENPAVLALSPNLCCTAVMSPAHKVDLSVTQYTPPDPTQTLENGTPAADTANAIIVLAFARSCWMNSNVDDLICMILSTFPASMSSSLIFALYQNLFRETEFMHEKDQRSELEKVVQKPMLTKVFSFHYGIGFLSTKNPLTNTLATNAPMPLCTQWVWIAANLRFVAQLLYISIREVQGSANNASNPSPELIDMVCGNIKWTLDLIRWIAATVIETIDRETNPEFFNPLKHPEQTSSDGSQGLVALLLNCHWSRQFFIAIVRAMRVLCKQPEPRSNAQKQIIRTIMQCSSGKGLNLLAVEALLDPRWSGVSDNELENDMQKISARQIRMMASGVVEGGYTGTVKRIATNLYQPTGHMRERGAVDRLKLWQSKVSMGWILLDDGWEGDDDGEGKERRPRNIYDVHKKKVITQGVAEMKAGSEEKAQWMIKRCVRCGRHNEDVNGMGQGFPRHVAGLMMRCVCDGPWIVVPWAEAAEG